MHMVCANVCVCTIFSVIHTRVHMQVGVYNSPHLFHWSEAVLINDVPDLEGWRVSMNAIQEALGDVDRWHSCV